MDNNEHGTNLAEVGTDCISRQQAIDALKRKQDDGKGDLSRFYNTIIQHDIEAIKQLPPIQPVSCSEFPNNSDTISRQAAIDGKICIQRSNGVEIYDDYVVSVEYLKQLPPAEPKRGRWVKLDMHRGMADHKCSVCEQECYVPTCMGEPMYAFCPNCGAKMEVAT